MKQVYTMMHGQKNIKLCLAVVRATYSETKLADGQVYLPITRLFYAIFTSRN